MLYEDWLNAEGDWSRSSIHYNSLEVNKYKKKGRYVYLTYKEVETKFGSALAKAIKKSKLELEASRAQDEEPWVCEHPDVKNDPVLCL